MSKKPKAAADKPSQLIDPEYRKKRIAKMKAEKDRYNELCGPVETKRIEKDKK